MSADSSAQGSFTSSSRFSTREAMKDGVRTETFHFGSIFINSTGRQLNIYWANNFWAAEPNAANFVLRFHGYFRRLTTRRGYANSGQSLSSAWFRNWTTARRSWHLPYQQLENRKIEPSFCAHSHLLLLSFFSPVFFAATCWAKTLRWFFLLITFFPITNDRRAEKNGTLTAAGYSLDPTFRKGNWILFHRGTPALGQFDFN